MSDHAQALYGNDESLAKLYRQPLNDSLNVHRDNQGLSQEAADKQLLDAARFFNDATVYGPTAGKLHGLIVNHLKTPATEEQRQDWTIDQRRRLRETYGKAADTVKKQVDEYISAHPTIKVQLQKSGVIDHPEVVMTLAEKARLLRLRSR